MSPLPAVADGGYVPAWLPDVALAPLGSRRVALLTAPDEHDDPVLSSVRDELVAAARIGGGTFAAPGSAAGGVGRLDVVLATVAGVAASADDGRAEARAAGDDTSAENTDALDAAARAMAALTARPGVAGDLARQGFVAARSGGTVVVAAAGPVGLLAGFHHLVRQGGNAFGDDDIAPTPHLPGQPVRMLDHWDNIAADSPMGPVERGYAGASLWFVDGKVRDDLDRVAHYARLLAHIGINAVGLNNVNVHHREAALLTEHLGDVARLAAVFRRQGIRTYLSVDFAAPITLGGLSTSDPLDDDVRAWWEQTARDVYATIPDFGGFVVKADSEGRPGPFAYGRTHADGANMLARALAPFGGTVFWRAFVYNHHQDWRDRSTDRARAAFDHFSPLDAAFDDNVVVQVKYGPLDFQAREPVSPVLSAMPRTRVALELQVTQEYTGQQQHVCYLGPQWREILAFEPWGAAAAPDEGDDAPRALRDVIRELDPSGTAGGGIVAVANVGDDPFWTGHPLAQANLYAFGRLAWDPSLAPAAMLDEWATLTFPDLDDDARATVHAVMDDSWRTYERYTAPLGVCFMVRPNHHYGPDVDGYEYTPWGTYHFADRDGVGVDRTRATGTGFTGQYPAPWREVYESLATVPDELLLFFHHVPYTHVLHSGTTVVQHIYDTHFAGAEQTELMAAAWARLEGRVPPATFARVQERLAEQVRCAHEWRDQVNTYFWRKSGIPDERGRTIY